MKRVGFLFLVSICIFYGCGRKVDFIQLMWDDLEVAVKEFPDSTVRLLEIQTTLTNPVSEAGSKVALYRCTEDIQWHP